MNDTTSKEGKDFHQVGVDRVVDEDVEYKSVREHVNSITIYTWTTAITDMIISTYFFWGFVFSKIMEVRVQGFWFPLYDGTDHRMT
ncbi:unnamed protein product [Prunus armeniaca]